jgi:hypothetical protein
MCHCLPHSKQFLLTFPLQPFMSPGVIVINRFDLSKILNASNLNSTISLKLIYWLDEVTYISYMLPYQLIFHFNMLMYGIYKCCNTVMIELHTHLTCRTGSLHKCSSLVKIDSVDLLLKSWF